MIARPLLFLSSFAPLFALLAFRFDRWWLTITCGILTLLGVGSLYLLFRLDRRASPGAHKIVSVRDAGAEAGAYLGAYLLPFVTVSTPTVRDAFAYLGFFVVAGSVYIHSSVVQINPLLYVFGYRVLAVTDSFGWQGYLVTRKRVAAGDIVEATRFRGDVLMDRTPARRQPADGAQGG